MRRHLSRTGTFRFASAASASEEPSISRPSLRRCLVRSLERCALGRNAFRRESVVAAESFFFILPFFSFLFVLRRSTYSLETRGVHNSGKGWKQLSLSVQLLVLQMSARENNVLSGMRSGFPLAECGCYSFDCALRDFRNKLCYLICFQAIYTPFFLLPFRI